MQLSNQRVLSIDAFRGITIWIMIFVNELSGVSGIPLWMKHMPADADAMTFVDVVFPAFLFIVGMSIPFAIKQRRAKGDPTIEIQKHIVIRTIGLLVLGVFMVNAEGGYNQQAMPLSIYAWSMLFYVAVILVWNVYKSEQRRISIALRVVGILMLLILAFVYQGDDGTHHITPQWWGILGLIGWAYLISSMLYEIVKGNMLALIVIIVICTGYYMIGHAAITQSSALWKALSSQGGHASLVSIAVCGILLTQIFFNQEAKAIKRKFTEAMIFTGLLLVGGFILRPYYHISKIHATPTWCLYSAAICCVIFMILYWIIDLKKLNNWTAFFKPAASNPLLTYIIPFIVYAVMQYFNVSFPEILYTGVGGILWCSVYATVVMGFVILLNRWNIRLQL